MDHPFSKPTPVERPISLLNGALIGAGRRLRRGCSCAPALNHGKTAATDVGPIVLVVALGAGIGIAVDSLIRKRRPAAPAASSPLDVHAAPIVDRAGKRVGLTLRF